MRRLPRITPATFQDLAELEKRPVTGQQKWHAEIEKWESVYLNPRRQLDHEEALRRLSMFGFCYQITPVDKETLKVEIKSARKGKTLKDFYAHQHNTLLLRKLVSSYPVRSIEVGSSEKIKRIETPYDGTPRVPIHLIETMPTISHLETIAFGFPDRKKIKLEGVTEADLSGRSGREHDERPQVNLFVYNSGGVIYHGMQPNGHVAVAGYTTDLPHIDTIARTLRSNCDLKAQIAGDDDEVARKLRLILRHDLTVPPTMDDVYRKTA